ncbi:MAG: TRL-like family protein [Bacteroidales bacterium]|jgi:hypothetical protein|nr:TRL-like family protein [Bacteroidales bacterium]
MKKIITFMLVFANLAGCTYTRAPEFVLNEEKGLEIPENLNSGKSCRVYLFYFISGEPEYKDSAIEAARKGNISKIIYVDQERTIFPLFSKSCTRVWGETNYTPGYNKRMPDSFNAKSGE